LKELEQDPKDVSGAFGRAFVKTDDEIEENKIQYSGTTVISVLIREEAEGVKRLYSANVGDARTVLWYVSLSLSLSSCITKQNCICEYCMVSGNYYCMLFSHLRNAALLVLSLSLSLSLIAAVVKPCVLRVTTRAPMKTRLLVSKLLVASLLSVVLTVCVLGTESAVCVTNQSLPYTTTRFILPQQAFLLLLVRSAIAP
jgi:hypothetical protein